jgi:hypothetical protein
VLLEIESNQLNGISQLLVGDIAVQCSRANVLMSHELSHSDALSIEARRERTPGMGRGANARQFVDFLKQHREGDSRKCTSITLGMDQWCIQAVWWADWPAPGSEDTELGVLMELEVGHGETSAAPGEVGSAYQRI